MLADCAWVTSTFIILLKAICSGGLADLISVRKFPNTSSHLKQERKKGWLFRFINILNKYQLSSS